MLASYFNQLPVIGWNNNSLLSQDNRFFFGGPKDRFNILFPFAVNLTQSMLMISSYCQSSANYFDGR